MVRVLVVDDFTPWYNFVAATVESDPTYRIIGFVSDGPQAIEQCRSLSPDVILLDINLSGVSGMLVAEEIREVAPAAQIIFFTDHISIEFVTAAFEVGASGFVAKRDCREILPAVNTVMSGRRYLSERVREFRIDSETDGQ